MVATNDSERVNIIARPKACNLTNNRAFMEMVFASSIYAVKPHTA